MSYRAKSRHFQIERNREPVKSSEVEMVFISLHFDKAQYRLDQGDNSEIKFS